MRRNRVQIRGALKNTNHNHGPSGTGKNKHDHHEQHRDAWPADHCQRATLLRTFYGLVPVDSPPCIISFVSRVVVHTLSQAVSSPLKVPCQRT